MSSIIETRTRGTFHVEDDPRAARAELRASAAIGGAAVFLTAQCKHPVAITYAEVTRVRKPGEPARWKRKLRAWALFIGGLAILTAGVAGIAVGGSALVLHVMGHGEDTPVSWLFAIPGFAGYYAGGWIAAHACVELGIE